MHAICSCHADCKPSSAVGYVVHLPLFNSCNKAVSLLLEILGCGV